MKVITVGRSSNNDIVIRDDDFVGRNHCQIVQYRNGNFGLVDFGSKNGTYVNGKRVQGEIPLQLSDVVKIGNTTLRWREYFVENVYDMPERERREERSSFINIPSEININQNIKNESAEVRRRGDDFSVGFFRNMGDNIGNHLGNTIGCIASVVLVIAFIAVIVLLGRGCA